MVCTPRPRFLYYNQLKRSLVNRVVNNACDQFHATNDVRRWIESNINSTLYESKLENLEKKLFYNSNKTCIFFQDQQYNIFLPSLHVLCAYPNCYKSIIVSGHTSRQIIKGEKNKLTLSDIKGLSSSSLTPETQIVSIRVAGNSLPFAIGRILIIQSQDVYPDTEIIDLMHHCLDLISTSSKRPLMIYNFSNKSLDSEDLFSVQSVLDTTTVETDSRPQNINQSKLIEILRNEILPEDLEFKQTFTSNQPAKVSAPNKTIKEFILNEPKRDFSPNEPKKAAAPSEPKKAATLIEPKKAATLIEPKKAATLIEPKKAATLIEPKNAAAPSEPKNAATLIEPKKAAAPSEPKKAAAPSEPKKAAAPSEPKKAATPNETIKEFILNEPKRDFAPNEPKKAAALNEPQKAAAPNEPKKAATPIKPKKAATPIKPKKAATPIKPKKAAARNETIKEFVLNELKKAATPNDSKKASAQKIAKQFSATKQKSEKSKKSVKKKHNGVSKNKKYKKYFKVQNYNEPINKMFFFYQSKDSESSTLSSNQSCIRSETIQDIYNTLIDYIVSSTVSHAMSFIRTFCSNYGSALTNKVFAADQLNPILNEGCFEAIINKSVENSVSNFTEKHFSNQSTDGISKLISKAIIEKLQSSL